MSPTHKTLLIDNWDLLVEIRLHNGNCHTGVVDFTQLLQTPNKCEIIFDRVEKQPCPIKTHIRRLNLEDPGLVTLEVCFRNPNAMDHPNGNWDLGAKGNIILESCDLKLVPKDGTSLVDLNLHLADSDITYTAKKSMSIHQASSGGDAWQSTNHIDRTGRNQLPFRGYRITTDGKHFSGNRASPIISAKGESSSIVLAVQSFWQNFPIKFEATTKQIRLRLLASETDSPTELQGGEQKTFEIGLQNANETETNSLKPWLKNGGIPDTERLLTIAAKVPYFTQRDDDSDPRYEALVDLAIEGCDTFFTKREKIDEYGWRHFGDVWGDHEAVYHRGESPMISHYNNQYDCTLGFAIQYLRTRDRRWFDLMISMADHAWDIDTYHTSRDKSLYNGGLFWHTYHYADAHTATHRSYPKQLLKVDSFEDGKDLDSMGQTGNQLSKNYQVGGGPAGSHNYSTGWMLAYYLTGKERYREAAINAADYVLQLEDGNLTPFRWLCRSDTGYSTCSADGYYGPGRASANSTHALLTAHELTGDNRYLSQVEKLMRRTVHPAQNLEKLDLLNAELRWFYTMYLQALCRYLDYKVKLNQLDSNFRYGVAALRHYSCWMAEHEVPTLSNPDQLQYPTETWAAQDMRKWHVLEHASRYAADDATRKEMRNKADFFYDYVVDYLTKSKTNSLCRPLVLMLNFGWQREWFLKNRQSNTYTKGIKNDFLAHENFIPQRVIAIRRFKILVLTGSVTIGITCLLGLTWFLF